MLFPFDGKEGYALTPFNRRKLLQKKRPDECLLERTLDYQNTERRFISKAIPGAIVRIN
jgi:hypothetical protein